MMGRLRWTLFVPFGLFTVLVAVVGLRLGFAHAEMDESHVIQHYAAQYLKDHASQDGAGTARLTDCAAFPSADADLWLVVRCQPAGAGQVWDYHVRRNGRLAPAQPAQSVRPEA